MSSLLPRLPRGVYPERDSSVTPFPQNDRKGAQNDRGERFSSFDRLRMSGGEIKNDRGEGLRMTGQDRP